MGIHQQTKVIKQTPLNQREIKKLDITIDSTIKKVKTSIASKFRNSLKAGLKVFGINAAGAGTGLVFGTAIGALALGFVVGPLGPIIGGAVGLLLGAAVTN